MIKRISPFILAGLAIAWFASAAQSQNVVYTNEIGKDNKRKELKGKIEAETIKGIKISGAKEIIPTDNIFDVSYEVNPITIRISAYRPAVEADHKAAVAKEGVRKGLIEEALKKYQDALTGLDAGQASAQRNIEFRIAYLRALLAQEDPKDTAAREKAIDKLRDFKTKHPDGFQIGKALKTLAELQTEAGDFAEAEKSYRELAAADVADALKENAELLAATLAVRAKKYDAAEKNLNDLIARLPKGSRQNFRAQVALGDALREGKKYDAAKGIFQKVIDDTKENDLKAAAYNGLGLCELDTEHFQEARWHFLRVDVVYNQDRAEHARALYYLWQIFKHFNDDDRARDCLDTLLREGQFAGTEYQRRAQVESAKG